MKKILVTGATGFLGSRIVDFYRGKYDVCAPTHSELDIVDEKNVFNILNKYNPDIVIHCAAVSDVGICEKEPEKSNKINVEGSINVARASAIIRARCIVCSSDQVYFGSSMEGAHKEEEEVQPVNLYGKGKLKAEQECLKVNPDCILLRLSWMYDIRTIKEGEHGDFFRNLLPKINDISELYYPIYDKRGITDVNEVVQNLEKTFLIPGGVYNFGSPNDRSTFETIYKVFENVGVSVSRLRKNEEAFKDKPRNICMCQDKIEKYGVFFSTTVNGLSGNLEKVLK